MERPSQPTVFNKTKTDKEINMKKTIIILTVAATVLFAGFTTIDNQVDRTQVSQAIKQQLKEQGSILSADRF